MTPARGLTAVLLASLAVSSTATGARGQFEEPDTIPRLGIGPVIELTFRGGRGDVAGTDLELKNGPAFGLRVEYRFSRTGALAIAGTYARTEEQISSEQVAPTSALLGDMTLYQITGEILFKIKPSVPGYFVIGGGARLVDADDHEEDREGFTRTDLYREPMLTLGLGLEFPFSRRDAFRVAGRSYLAIPASQPEYDTQSILNDLALGFTYLHRF